MGRVWDTSKDLPKPFVTLCQTKDIQSHEVKKFKFKFLSLGYVLHVLWSNFRQEGKRWP